MAVSCVYVCGEVAIVGGGGVGEGVTSVTQNLMLLMGGCKGIMPYQKLGSE